MAHSALAGILIYAKHLERVSAFYQRVLGASVLVADAEHHVLDGANTQLIIHAIPPEYAASIEISTPPAVRDAQAIKPFFTVPNLAEAERVAVECGGLVWGPPWPGPGLIVRNVCDPEGNIVHLRQRTGNDGDAAASPPVAVE